MYALKTFLLTLPQSSSHTVCPLPSRDTNTVSKLRLVTSVSIYLHSVCAKGAKEKKKQNVVGLSSVVDVEVFSTGN